MGEAKFNPKWLEEKDCKTGEKLAFYEVEKSMVEKNGRKTLHAIRKEKPLTEVGILSWKEQGDLVWIVTKNGKKYCIKKKSGFGGKE